MRSRWDRLRSSACLSDFFPGFPKNKLHHASVWYWTYRAHFAKNARETGWVTQRATRDGMFFYWKGDVSTMGTYRYDPF